MHYRKFRNANHEKIDFNKNYSQLNMKRGTGASVATEYESKGTMNEIMSDYMIYK